MALIRRIDSNGDFIYGTGKADYATSKFCVALNIKTRLREWKYNWFSDYERGIDWRLRLGSKNQKDKLDSDIQSVILKTDEVDAIVFFEGNLDVRNRVYTASVVVATPYGNVDFEVEIGG